MNSLEPLAIVGGGRAGSTVAVALALTGMSPGLVVRNAGRRADLQAWLATLDLPRPIRVLADATALARANTVLLAVPDRELAALAVQLQQTLAPAPRTWLHLSGVAPAEVLRVPGSLAQVASVHPLCALPDPVQLRLDADATTQPLRGALMALDGEGPALAIAQQLAEALGGVPQQVYPEARAAYHAAAALVANDLVGLLALGTDACSRAGLPAAALRQGLLHLAQTSLTAVARLHADESLRQGLTGAVARGDAQTVGRHLDALDPGTREVHRLLSLRLLALMEGALPAEQIARLRQVLQ